ncbi:methylthioribulose-1-phosphate dehydratase [Peribacillus deserti]|uniref:Methylthioribulose-1-phosphate dehydratase n=2 Tax=Peribacillus deserti TaxID=673318 RepID=A0ABS2QIY7_9BACI|nr:methylthioribulose-1-phosphate dehydratase [Peribacillus deserti]
MMDYKDKWEELADIKDELAARDWFMGTSGNLSIRVSSNRFLVTASGKDKRKRTSEDFLLVDENGQAAEETHLKPSAETLLHTAVYNRTSAGCILHVHTAENNVISELYGGRGEIIFKGQEIIKAFGKWEEDAELRMPIIYNHAHIPTLADEFSAHIEGNSGAVLIRNHGITVWGTSGFEAKKLLEASEFLFRYELLLNQSRSAQALNQTIAN